MAKFAKVLLLETLGGILSSRSYRYGDELCDKHDRDHIGFSLSLWLFVLRDLSVTYGLERNFSDANLIRLSGRLAGCDFLELCEQLKGLKMQLRLVSPVQGAVSWKTVKVHLEQPLTSLQDVLSPFISIFAKTLRSDLFRDLNTICCFLERITLNGRSDLQENSAAEYWLLEASMINWHYDAHTISELQQVIDTWFADFQWEPLDPSFSSGATSEVRKGEGSAHKHAILLRTIEAEDENTFSSVYATEGCRDYRHPFKPVPRGNLVPKSADKKRLVCPEPTIHAYWQQALARMLDRHFRRHPEMRIDLHDQERTRELCLKASGSGGYSTVDLSSASDTVTVTLVKKIFANQPMLLALMLGCRSERAEVGGRTAVLEKFAPMGSALCFPVECIVFSAVCAVACRRAGSRHKYYVYGDDMIVSDEIVHILFDLLKQLHFLVNEEKSYGPYSQFLEACGMEAWCGFDVTPLRISRKIDFTGLGDRRHPHEFKRAVKLCNKLYGYGLFQTRYVLASYLLEFYPEAPFAVIPDKGIYHPDPVNSHLNTAYNTDLQVVQLQCLVFESKQEKGPDDIRYQLALERLARTDRKALMWPEDQILVKCGGTSAHLVHRWVTLENLR